MLKLVILALLASWTTTFEVPDVDPSGYILYCPCMGRFGNQADHLLGSLAFAAALNRTLVVPPFIEYRQGKTTFVSYASYFNLSSLSAYHRVLSLDYFMSHLAPSVWPVSSRTVLCHSTRKGPIKDSCNAKDGSPFGPFWDNFNINFVRSKFYSSDDLVLDVRFAENWKKKYGHMPVLAFVGAPASFPVRKEHTHLQKFVEWNEDYVQKTQSFINDRFGQEGYVGIHLRNGLDWERACELVPSVPTLFSSPQCTDEATLSKGMCLPSSNTVLTTVLSVLQNTRLHNLFVASDNDYMIDELECFLRRNDIENINVVRTDDDPHLDLALLEKSNHFIGNCVSSFSAFVVRARRERGKSCSFWGLNEENEKERDEL